MATETKIARVAFMDKGAYSAETEYSKWDFVTTEDSTYLYIGETSATGKPVTDTAYWKCIADGKQATVAAGLANNAATTANTAAGLADDAREAIQSDLGAKAFHGYGEGEEPKTLKEVDDEKTDHGYASIEVAKTLKQVEDDTSVKITNLIPNGGFESGVPSWSGTRPVLSGEEKLSGDSSGYVNLVSGVSYSQIDIVCDLNDKLYISVSRRFKTTPSDTSFPIRISDFGSLANSELYGRFYNGNLDVWETTTFITNGRTGGIRLGVGVFGSTVAEFFVDNFIVVNLTETFGEGNEPTKEEFELSLASLGIDFFEGEITVPAQKIMQWQLKLIRKNKNAIIALGGTII